MPCKYLFYVIVFSIFIFASSAQAQDPDVYVLEQDSVVGMTPLIGATERPGNGSTSKDFHMESSYGISIPFTFYFFDRTITTSSRLFAHPNGFVTLNSSTFLPYASNDQNFWTAPKTMDAPNSEIVDYSMYLFWDDLSHFHSPTGKISFKTTGSAPNRIFVIEYLDMQRKASTACADCYTDTGETGNISGQIWLHEGSNMIQYRYASAAGGMDWAAPMNASIGIRGSNSHADKAVTVSATQSTAPQSNFTFRPQFWSKWNGSTSSSMTSSSNWSLWNGGSTSPMSTSSFSANSRYTIYIPDSATTVNDPVLSNGNYYCGGMIVDAGGNFDMSGGTLNLLARGTGSLTNDGSITLSNDAELRIAGDLVNTGTFSATGGNTRVVFNGSLAFGSQRVHFGFGSFGDIDVWDNGDPMSPTQVIFEELPPGALSRLTSEAGTSVRMHGNTDLSSIAPGNLTIGGILIFSLIDAPATVNLGAATILNHVSVDISFLNKDFPLTFAGNLVADSLTITNNDKVQVQGSASIGNASLLPNCELDISGDLSVSDSNLNISSIGSLHVGGAFSQTAGSAYASIAASGDLSFGSIVCPFGEVILGSSGDITVTGDLIAGAGLTISATEDVVVGTIQVDPTSSVELPSVGSLRVTGALDILPASLLVVANSGVFEQDVLCGATILASPSLQFDGDLEAFEVEVSNNTLATVAGEVRSGNFTNNSFGDVSIGGDFVLGYYTPATYSSNNNASFNVGGDLVLFGDFNDSASGETNITGEIRGDGTIYSQLTSSFRANNLNVEGQNLIILQGVFEFLSSDQLTPSVSVGPDATLALEGADILLGTSGVGGGRLVVNGDFYSEFSSGPLPQSTIKGHVPFGEEATVDFLAGSKVNVNNTEFDDIGAPQHDFGIIFHPGSQIQRFENVSVWSYTSRAAISLQTTDILGDISFGTFYDEHAPYSIDASTISGEVIVISGYDGSQTEFDPNRVLFWANQGQLEFISAQELPDATPGQLWSFMPEVVGATGPVQWEFSAAAPAFLAFDPFTGSMTGTPTMGDIGTHTISVYCWDTSATSNHSTSLAYRSFSLEVLDPNAPSTGDSQPDIGGGVSTIGAGQELADTSLDYSSGGCAMGNNQQSWLFLALLGLVGLIALRRREA